MFQIQVDRNIVEYSDNVEETLGWILNNPSVPLKNLQLLLKKLKKPYHLELVCDSEKITANLNCNKRKVIVHLPVGEFPLAFPPVNCHSIRIYKDANINLETTLRNNPNVQELYLDHRFTVEYPETIATLPKLSLLEYSCIDRIETRDKNKIIVHITGDSIERLGCVPKKVTHLDLDYINLSMLPDIYKYILSDFTELKQVNFGCGPSDLNMDILMNLVKYRMIHVSCLNSDDSYRKDTRLNAQIQNLCKYSKKLQGSKWVYMLKYIPLQSELLRMLVELLVNK